MLKFVSILLAAAMLGACQVDTASGTQVNSKKVIGYFPNWLYNNFPINGISFEKYTHINYAFALQNQVDGAPHFEDDWAVDNYLPQLVQGAHAKNTKVLLSVGGWTGSKEFSPMVASPDLRKRFIDWNLDFIQKYNTDGVDIDWEYPAKQATGCNTFHESDTDNLLLLLKELRQSLDQRFPQDRKLISMAVYVKPFLRNGEPAKDVSDFVPYFDYINLMTYDINGAWANNTGPNAPFEADPASGNQFSYVDSIRSWKAAGVPSEKINAGLAFYGRSMQALGDMASNPTQQFQQSQIGAPKGDKDDAYWANPFCAADMDGVSGIWKWSNLRSEGLIQPDLVTPGNGWQRFWDDRSKTPWLFNSQSKIFISYDDPVSLGHKVNYALCEGLGGVMAWDLHQDNGELTESIQQALRLPPINCTALLPSTRPSPPKKPTPKASAKISLKQSPSAAPIHSNTVSASLDLPTTSAQGYNENNWTPGQTWNPTNTWWTGEHVPPMPTVQFNQEDEHVDFHQGAWWSTQPTPSASVLPSSMSTLATAKYNEEPGLSLSLSLGASLSLEYNEHQPTAHPSAHPSAPAHSASPSTLLRENENDQGHGNGEGHGNSQEHGNDQGHGNGSEHGQGNGNGHDQEHSHPLIPADTPSSKPTSVEHTTSADHTSAVPTSEASSAEHASAEPTSSEPTSSESSSAEHTPTLMRIDEGLAQPTPEPENASPEPNQTWPDGPVFSQVPDLPPYDPEEPEQPINEPEEPEQPTNDHEESEAPEEPTNEHEEPEEPTDEPEETHQPTSEPEQPPVGSGCNPAGAQRCAAPGVSAEWLTCVHGDWVPRDCAAGLVCFEGIQADTILCNYPLEQKSALEQPDAHGPTLAVEPIHGDIQ